LFLALFEDGDVPGECMFSFQSKQNKTPISIKKYKTSQPGKKICSEGKLSYKY